MALILEDGYSIANKYNEHLVFYKNLDWDEGISTTGNFMEDVKLARHCMNKGNSFLASSILLKHYFELLLITRDKPIYYNLIASCGKEDLIKFFKEETGIMLDFVSLINKVTRDTIYNKVDSNYRVELPESRIIEIDSKGEYISLVVDNVSYTIDLVPLDMVNEYSLNDCDLKIIIESLIYFLFYRVERNFSTLGVKTTYAVNYAEHCLDDLDVISNNILRNIENTKLNSSNDMNLFSEKTVEEKTKYYALDFYSKDGIKISSIPIELTKDTLNKYKELSKEKYDNGNDIMIIRG